jgi:predicted nucleic acid-binding protein
VRFLLDTNVLSEPAMPRADERALSAAGDLAGRLLPVIDGLLLATAATHGLTFVTRNEADCAERGVPLLNPWSG